MVAKIAVEVGKEGIESLNFLGIFTLQRKNVSPTIAPRHIPYQVVGTALESNYGSFNHYEYNVVWSFWGILGLVNGLRGKK